MCRVADLSVLEIDLITDDGLHHKSVLKVPNAVAIPCLTFNDAWKEGGKGERERSFSHSWRSGLRSPIQLRTPTLYLSIASM